MNAEGPSFYRVTLAANNEIQLEQVAQKPQEHHAALAALSNLKKGRVYSQNNLEEVKKAAKIIQDRYAKKYHPITRLFLRILGIIKKNELKQIDGLYKEIKKKTVQKAEMTPTGILSQKKTGVELPKKHVWFERTNEEWSLDHFEKYCRDVNRAVRTIGEMATTEADWDTDKLQTDVTNTFAYIHRLAKESLKHIPEKEIARLDDLCASFFLLYTWAESRSYAIKLADEGFSFFGEKGTRDIRFHKEGSIQSHWKNQLKEFCELFPEERVKKFSPHIREKLQEAKGKI